ncbi:nucleobase:cation symporter-2 family protein [Schwartzia succinivorans]|jgi:NCS2 family nucleobase:cation symporter-2|uniref:Nucleobase:cation symporter-2, NCS2 family n=1 Tax=Schwartzia succinivorans DSM 10502 TaxID=1123243 RepID=A0A1M4UWT2_9FIRM|nr:nucleobase:cation symporter-2 family protein [Schwartzia succinivorans]MBQ3863888.1 purine permease [Schwartzia sp. (in: firmicutes)]SHE61201.1 nucleobase:cation symporter-2, NCS2 family [Schwartzia succinivorans DSM 10502]
MQSSKVHPVDKKLPFWQLLIYGFQHVLAMYSGAVAVPLVLAGAIHLDVEHLIYLINADLFTCGIATLVQTLSMGPYIGSKLPIVQGCTFTAVTPMILIANSAGGGAEGLRVVYGSVIVAGLICFITANYFSKLLRFFPPVVTGAVITIIGLTLMPVAVGWIAGVNPAAPDYAAPMNIMIALLVLVLILFLYRVSSGFIGHIAVLLGLIFGTVVAALLGYVDFSAVGQAASLGITTPFAFGMPVFEPVSCIAMTLVMLVTMAETTGDVIAVGKIVNKPTDEEILCKALRADGFSTALGGILNAFPYTAFAQNIGLVSITGVRSRYVVAMGGVILMILGLLPKLAAVVACIPNMVLGGAGLAMFGMVAASGIQALSKVNFVGNCNMMVIAVSVAVALIPIGAPTFYSKFPTGVQLICTSGITIGSITAILLNLILNKGTD